MFGVLLESRARRQSRTGGAALSVAAHTAIIGAITAAAAHRHIVAQARDTTQVYVHFAAPRAAPPTAPAAPPRFARPIDIATLRNLRVAPLNLTNVAVAGPVVDFSGAVNVCADCDGTASRPSTFFASNPPKAPGLEEWRGAELMMRMLAPVVPRYPEALRSAGVEGTVIVQFTVDTTGRVDMNSLKILSSTHDLFTAAVRDALTRFRFKPAEVDGRRVPAMGQMPFEFRLKRGD